MLRHFFKKFGYAFTGLTIAWREESSFRVQVVGAFAVLLFARFLNLSGVEFAVVVLTISFVFTAEVFNTALEELCDKFQPTQDPHIAKIKDLAAAAVLLSSIGAVIVGVIIFVPHL